jgi:hypothetical protein
MGRALAKPITPDRRSNLDEFRFALPILRAETITVDTKDTPAKFVRGGGRGVVFLSLEKRSQTFFVGTQ